METLLRLVVLIFCLSTNPVFAAEPPVEIQLILDGPLISDEALAGKLYSREKIFEAAGLRLDSGMNERIDDFFGGSLIKSLPEIESRRLLSMHAPGDTWSGSTWSHYRGASSQRYAEKPALNAKDWPSAWAYASTDGRSLNEIVSRGREDEINRLGPAEKYDLLIGATDDTGVLSGFEWSQGGKVQRKTGTVPTWFGYCHGWAPASFMVERPLKAVTVMAADGRTPIRFYPEDIKGLATVLYANALPFIKVLGGRCDTANPPRDRMGRVIDPKCLDVNPGTFLLALVNQIGIGQKHLLIDATFDEEIWNQPIRSYEVTYYNPQTKRSARTFKKAMVAKSKFRKDKFKAYRSADAISIVGVKLQVEFALKSVPAQRERDAEKYDKLKKQTYQFDVELDSNDNVIGGEWYQTRHPDFLWVPTERAKTDVDLMAEGSWDTMKALPEAWRKAARTSGQKGQPLSEIVQRLVELSRQ